MNQPDDYGKNDPLAMVVEFLEKTGNTPLADQVLDVFAEYSDNIEQFNMLAKLYLDIRSNQKAQHYALQVLKLSRNSQEKYAARANLAKMYNNLNMPEKSILYSNENRDATPDNPETLMEMVFSLYLLNRNDEAEKILRQLKMRSHTLSERMQTLIDFNLGTYDMSNGKFLEGLKGFMFNTKKLGIWYSPRELPFRPWTGQSDPGKTLIMFMEGGGIGDDFIMIRFYRDLEKMGFKPLFYTAKKDVAEIFNKNGYNATTSVDDVPMDSLWCFAMHVPIYLNVDPETLDRGKYLQPSEQARAKWSWVKDGAKLKVGVRWQGNAKNERDLHRQVPLDQIMRTLHQSLDGKQVEFYSLQIGDDEESAKQYSELINVSEQIKSFDDTFALLENLDLVVSSCTSVLHASAIMGTKTYGLIPISAYFTWISPAPPHRSIWYGNNLKIFRQTVTRDWTQPLEQLGQHIQQDLEENQS